MKAHTLGARPISGCEDREDQQGHRGDHLAAAPVGPQGERHRPQQLGHRGHEGHRPEGGVVDVEGVLEVGPDDGDAVAEGARHDGRRGEEHQGGEAAGPEDPEQRRRLALAGAGHDWPGRRSPRGCCSWRRPPCSSSSGTAKSNTTWSAIESHTLSLTVARHGRGGRLTAGPGPVDGQTGGSSDGVATVSGPWGSTHSRAPGCPASAARASANRRGQVVAPGSSGPSAIDRSVSPSE